MCTEKLFDSIAEETLRKRKSNKWSVNPGTVGAHIAEMDFGVSSEVKKVLQRYVDTDSLGYVTDHDQYELSKQCSAWINKSYKWEVPAENIRPLPDVLTGLAVAINHFSPPGSSVVVPTPGHKPFLRIPYGLGREIIQLPMLPSEHGWEFDYEGLDKAFLSGAGLLILCNPHNPIGKVYSREEMIEISSVVERHKARVVSDEIHSPIVFPGRNHIPYASISTTAANHAVTITSATKAWNVSGLKCAQLILSNSKDKKEWSRIGFLTEHQAGHLGIAATIAAYKDGGEWLEKVISYLDENRRAMSRLVHEHIPAISYKIPEGTYLAWLDCRKLELGSNPSEFFREAAGVTCSDGAEFGDEGKGFIRFNFAMPRPILERAIKNMGEAVRNSK